MTTCVRVASLLCLALAIGTSVGVVRELALDALASAALLTLLTLALLRASTALWRAPLLADSNEHL